MATNLRERLRSFTPVWVRPAARAAERLMIRGARTFLPNRLPINSDGKVYLHLGSGHVIHPSCINVDALVAWHIHYICPIDKLKPIPDEYADLVYASHCLEHFSHHKVAAVLAEWYRVLKPGGVLRVGVPDFDQLIAIYEYSGHDVNTIQWTLMGGQTYPLNFHMIAFNRKLLTDLFLATGFREVREWRRGTGPLTDLHDCTALEVVVNGKTFPISLNMEAVK